VDGVNVTSWLRLVVSVSILGLSLLAVEPAGAQTPSRPYRGLFGGGEPMSTRGQMIDLSMSAFAGWDQPQNVNVTPFGSSSSERTDVSGPFGGGSGQVTYSHPGKHFSFDGAGSAFAGYFRGNELDPWYDSYAAYGNLGWSADLSRRSHFRFVEHLSYSTDYNSRAQTLMTPTPPPDASSGFETALIHSPSVVSLSGVEFGYDYTAKTSLTMHYDYQLRQYLSSTHDFSDYGTQRAGVRFNHKITKTMGYHLGYSYQQTMVFDSDEQSTTFHGIDAGVDVDKALSLTRTTQFTFSVSTTFAAGNSPGSDQPPFGDQRLYLLGHAELRQALGRSWSEQTYYHRTINYEVGFGQPVLYDIVGADVRGLISPRIDVLGGVSYHAGRIGLTNSNYKDWYVNAQVRGAISRQIAAFAYYYYVLSDFAADVTLPTGVPRHIDRQGVRVGLTAWLPIWHGRGTQ
jgi:hypothetical protein